MFCGPRFALVAGVVPAAFEAGAVVGEHALDPDPVPAVEADAGLEEGDRRGGGLVWVERGEAQPAGIVDRDEQVLPAGFALRALRAVAGDAVAGPDDPAELLAVDVHELARPLALVADDLLRSAGGTSREQPMAAQDRVHRRGRQTERPADHVRARLQLRRARSTARSTAAGIRRGERCGRDERSSEPLAARARPTHFDAV